MFAQQSGIQFLLRTSLAEGLETQGVHGRMSDAQALAILLKDSGLSVEFAAADIIVVSEAEVAAAQVVPVEKEAEYRDQLIVSARRRKESVEDYPGVAATFNPFQLEVMQVDGAEDIIHRLANAHIEERPGSQANIYIRGIGTETSGSGTRTDAGIGLYYDGVYTYLQGSRIPPIYYDLQRVEVLKGPQGGLYGRNAVGGAVIAEPASPIDEFGAKLRFERGNYDFIKTGGFVNVPISEHAALRVAGFYASQDSYYENVFTGGPEEGERTFSMRARLKLLPTSDSEILIGYERTREDKGAQILVPDEFGLRHISVANTQGFSDRDTDRLILKGAWRQTDWELQTVTGYTRLKAQSAFDFNNIRFRPSTADYFVGEEQRAISAWQFSQDVLAVSTTDGPLQWLLGVGLFVDDQDADVAIRSGFPSTGLIETDGASMSHTRMASAFADVSYYLTPRLSVNASLRYSNEVRKGSSSDSVIVSSETGTPVAAPFQEFKTSYGKLSPAISLQYEISRSLKAFAKVTTGYQSGGINTRASSSAATAFGPSTAINYEGGFRGNWFDKKILLTVAAFQLNQNDFHYRIDNPPFDEFVNNGKARTHGVDLEAIVRPRDWLEFTAAYGYLHAKIVSTPNAAFEFPAGSRKPGSPQHTFVLGVNLERPVPGLSGGVFRLNADYASIQNRYTNNVLVPLEDYDLINARAGLVLHEQFEVYAYVQNLTNDINTITPGISGSRIISPPRAFGVGVSLSH